MGILGRLIALAGVVEAARRFAKNNPAAVGKIADQAGRLVDQFTKGKFSDQIDGAVRKVQDATGRDSA
ncbi:MAG: antitoxin [Pseudonocardiales bacterium]|nr:antitoxin [Pseudonocardiales bacterium]MBV9030764.1 antitoxin [Pseudonocardiales bacterium]MBW0010365.1 antitoxin [Pseudonocardiales bacterium]